MKISLCIPCGNRARDLERTLPYLAKTVNDSPPAEIAILDYNSHDGLARAVALFEESATLGKGNNLVYTRYTGRDHYHLAHAYNLAVLSSSGDYVVVAGADAVLSTGYVRHVRQLVAEGCVWMRPPHYKGIVACKRQEFVEAGGYDERFEMYGGEDREFESRLKRRGGKFGLIPDGLVRTIRTPNSEKTKNYRLELSKLEMIERGRRIRDENDAAGLLVANPAGWGQWR